MVLVAREDEAPLSALTDHGMGFLSAASAFELALRDLSDMLPLIALVLGAVAIVAGDGAVVLYGTSGYLVLVGVAVVLWRLLRHQSLLRRQSGGQCFVDLDAVLRGDSDGLYSAVPEALLGRAVRRRVSALRGRGGTWLLELAGRAPEDGDPFITTGARDFWRVMQGNDRSDRRRRGAVERGVGDGTRVACGLLLNAGASFVRAAEAFDVGRARVGGGLVALSVAAALAWPAGGMAVDVAVIVALFVAVLACSRVISRLDACERKRRLAAVECFTAAGLLLEEAVRTPHAPDDDLPGVAARMIDSIEGRDYGGGRGTPRVGGLLDGLRCAR